MIPQLLFFSFSDFEKAKKTQRKETEKEKNTSRKEFRVFSTGFKSIDFGSRRTEPKDLAAFTFSYPHAGSLLPPC